MIKTLKKWEKRFQLKQDQMDTHGCKCSEKCHRKTCVKGNSHLQAVKLSKGSDLGVEVYQDILIINLRLNPADKDSLQAIFNTTYYVLKKERLFKISLTYSISKLRTQSVNLCTSYSTPEASAFFADYIGKVMFENLKKLISKANNFPVLSDGSSGSIFNEPETIYILFICEVAPVLKYHSTKNVKNDDAPHLKSTLGVEFNHFGIICHYGKLVGLNLDGGASTWVNITA